MKRHFLLYYLLLWFSFNLQAQQPSYYVIGEEELAGVAIFSITQDKESNIWLSTNDGIIKYNGYTYSHYKNKEAKSNSLFGLTKDNNGDIYCCNLSGQIFKIKNDSLHLFYEIPDSLLANLIHFNFDNKNRLVFCTNNYYVVKENGTIQFLYPSKYSSNRIAKTKKEELIFIDFLSKEIAYYKDDKVLIQKSIGCDANLPFVTENNIYLAKSNTTKVYLKETSKWSKINLKNVRNQEKKDVNFYPINDTIFAFVYKNNGICFYHKNGTRLYNKSKLFPRYRISGTLKDKEGNIWLTTLGKGIIIIPNTTIIDFNNHPLLKQDDLKAITSDKKGNIYVAGLNGFIYKIKDKKTKIIKKVDSQIEFLKHSSNTNTFFYQDGIILLNSKNKKTVNFSSMKDLCIIDSNHYFLATSQGLFSAILKKNKSIQMDTTLINVRTYCVSYDKKNKEIWAGTIKGLELLSHSKKHIIQYKKQQICVTDIEYINDEIWVSTCNNGILIFKNGKFSRLFDYTEKHKIKHIYKLKFRNKKLYFTSEQGLSIYNFTNQQVKNYSKTDGLLSDKIKKFELVNNQVWLLFENGLQCIEPNKISKNLIAPTITWKDILINNKSYKKFDKNLLNHNQNQIEFRFIANAFRHRGSLTYHYKLEGLNDTWQEISYENNYIKFSSLPNGSYNFKVKAINENNVESPTISYAFTIKPPFWLTWWFFVLSGIGIIIIVSSYFIVRLNTVRKRLTLEKQLKVSEITAIKAQMNPHFIFNALNSIQDLIMLKDIRNSNIYLGKFAYLMRKTLEYSGKNFIDLTYEMEMLQLYLELEKLRFGNDFETVINCKINDKKLHELQIPSMFLQPYVENAVKHGLLHKKGHKKLEINFYLKETTLICEIIDNGVGRKKSEEIKHRREKSHPSFSTEANKKRIDLIRESTNMNISIKFIDLEENGISTGTKVIFQFS